MWLSLSFPLGFASLANTYFISQYLNLRGSDWCNVVTNTPMDKALEPGQSSGHQSAYQVAALRPHAHSWSSQSRPESWAYREDPVGGATDA